MKRREFIALIGGAGAGLFAVHFPDATLAQEGADWVTAFPRAPIPVAVWPAGRKVAISFALFIEEFGFGQGPVFRPDLASRNPDRGLPLGRGLAAQKAYVRETLDVIAGATGVRPVGWSSPSVYSNGDTMQAVAAEGITYTIDQMDSDIISRLKTPDGSLIQLPYPVVTVDMGQHLARMKMPAEIETLWLDYVLELAAEARADPAREATTAVIGIHPFVIGTPDGAAALRRVLSRLKKDDQVWLTDTDAILKVAGLK